MAGYSPKIVCFSCKFSWGYLSDEEELAGRIRNWVPIICSGKIDTTHVLEAFRKGADGVLILGCRNGECHFQDGNLETRKRMYILQDLLEAYGIEKERLRVQLDADPDGNRIAELTGDMARSIAALGPLKKLDRDPKKMPSV